jgi:predicted TIM-barrel fold metal-dependent hydrolase
MFVDIHVHARRLPGPPRGGKQAFATPEQLLARYDALGIESAVVLPMVSPEFYPTQDVDDLFEMAERFPGRFIPFCNVDPRGVANAPDAPLDELLNYYRSRGAKGLGEITANLPFTDPLVQNLFKHVERAGLPVIFHVSWRLGGDYGLCDEPGLPQLESCLARFPKLTFLGHSTAFWAEIAALEKPHDRRSYPPYPVRAEGVVPKLMRQYPNLHGDLSAGSGHNALARDPDYGPAFLAEFQDRLYFGTDICAPDTPTPLVDLLLDWRAKGRISDTVFRKVARENAAELLGIAATR